MSTSFWASRREATLNWLALGLLLAAWNAADNDLANNGVADHDVAGNDMSVDRRTASARRRPEALRGYDYVSVRAVQRSAAFDR
jgi:hypothetical protein